MSTFLGSAAARLLRRFHSSPPSTGAHQQARSLLACRLNSRGVIRFHGPDAARFLQGLLTNDVLPLAAPSPTGESSYLMTPNAAFRISPPVYSALLTPQGRFLFDLFLYRAPPGQQRLNRMGSGPGDGANADEDSLELLADVDSSVLEEAMDFFKRFRLRSKVGIDNVSKQFSCWQRFGSNLCVTDPSTAESEVTSIGWGMGIDRAGESAAQTTEDGWQWFRDPRLDCLGCRALFPSNTIPPLVESDQEIDERNYLSWRLEKGVAEGPIEIPKGEAIPLEYNLAGLNAISFDKGCYVGQELVARTHHRGIIRKRLTPFKFLDDNGEEVEPAVAPNTDVVSEESGKKIGTVNVALGCRGMGLVRLEEAFKQSSKLSIKGREEVKVVLSVPKWWPEHWIQPVHEQTASA